MRTHMIPRKPAELDWAKIPALQIDHILWLPDADITAQAQLCYDEEAIYVRMSAKEAHIRAENTSLTDQPCLDSCLEFFFCPDPEDLRYFNIEFNPNCCLYLGIGDGKGNLVRLMVSAEKMLNAQAARTEDGWEITYQVPISFICLFFPEFVATPGKSIKANFYKCGELTVQNHYLAWNNITCDTPAFHRPCDFGLLTFA